MKGKTDFLKNTRPWKRITMKKYLSLILIGLTLPLITFCSSAKPLLNSSLPSQENPLNPAVSSQVIAPPDIAFDREKAFYPFRKNPEGQIVPSYSSDVCIKKFLGVCLKWENRVKFFGLEWFEINDFGACKRPRPPKL